MNRELKEAATENYLNSVTFTDTSDSFGHGFNAGYSANAKLIEDVIEFLSRKSAKDTLPYGGGASGEGIIASAPVSEIDSLIYRLRQAIEPEGQPANAEQMAETTRNNEVK